MNNDPVADTSIIGNSVAIQRAIGTARRFAPTHIPILLTGETGTGKELFAQVVHRWSGRPGHLVDVNCGALPRDLIEGELFGHRRGAYTGASSDNAGLIAHADKGTLFLDELSSLPLEGQVKLLRALETREVRRVGDTSKRLIDFRLVAAVQKRLSRQIREGQFRNDLFQRLAGVVIDLPALVDRIEDAVPLATHFAMGRQCSLGRGANRVLERHQWPGNVRELKTVIDRAAVLCRDNVIDSSLLAEAIDWGLAAEDDCVCLTLERRRDERARLLEAARLPRGSAQALADDLGISRATLFRRLRELGLRFPARLPRRTDADVR